MFVEAVRDDGAVRELMHRQAAIFQRFSEDMRRYALKHSAVRRHLSSQEEEAAAGRGLLLVVGCHESELSLRRRRSALKLLDEIGILRPTWPELRCLMGDTNAKISMLA